MKKLQQKFLVRKVLLGLFPTILLWQNYAWMTANKALGIAFILIFAAVLWNVWKFTDKNHISSRYFRLSEVAMFLLPLSAIIMSFVIGAESVSSTSNELEQTGAAIGTAIGGTFVVIFAVVIGVIGGTILHLIGKRYHKKVEQLESNSQETLAYNHGVLLTLVSIFVLAIILGMASSVSSHIEEPIKDLQQYEEADKSASEVETETVSLKIIDKGFHEASYMDGDFDDQVTLDLKFINKTGKQVRGIKGTITFYDIFDDEIYSAAVSYYEGIEPSGEIIWEAGLDYNEFIDEHEKLKNISLENLQYTWEVEKVVYGNEESI